MTLARIPLVDFEDLALGGRRRGDAVRALGAGLETYGFVNVVGHGTSAGLLERAYAAAAAVFALPTAVKVQYEDAGIARQRGYTSFGVERAKGRDTADLKEFWHVGRDLPPDHPLSVSGDVPANLLPRELPEVCATFRVLYARQEAFAVGLLGAIGEFLGVAPGFFEELVRDGNSVLRVIHYPDVGPVVPGAVRAAQHEDINVLTVLPASTRPGLELMTRDGEWHAIEAPPGVMICDTGDMMQRLTGAQLPATTHRVVNPPNADGGRLSMPFFLHPHPDALLTPLRGVGPSISARAYLHERLVENGVA